MIVISYVELSHKLPLYKAAAVDAVEGVAVAVWVAAGATHSKESFVLKVAPQLLAVGAVEPVAPVVAGCNGTVKEGPLAATNRMGVGAVATVLPPARAADALNLRARAAGDLLPELRVRVQAVDVG